MTKNSAKLRSIKKRCFKKRVSTKNTYRSSVVGGSKPVYVLYLVSGAGPENEKTGIKNRVLDICAVSEDKNDLYLFATDVPEEVYIKKLKNIDKEDPILNNLYIDQISLESGVTQPHKFEKVDVLLMKSMIESKELQYVEKEPKKYHITINPTFGLIETISIKDKNCVKKVGSKSSFGQMEGQHCIWSDGLTYNFEYKYSVNNRSQDQKDNINNFNYRYGTDFE
jgi:hypothetical protein